MQIELNSSVTGNDLARLLDGEQGTFVAQNNGTSYVVTAAAGHSIKSLRPIGAIQSDPEKWQVTKISQSDLDDEYSRTQQSRNLQRQQ